MLGTALGAVLLVGSVTMPAFAALGGDASSVDDDVVKMKGQSRTTTPAGGYSVSETTLPSGTVLREYVSPDGKVFAVTWKGAVPPDLTQTLGVYYAQFKAAATATPRASHHNVQVRQDDLVVITGGHMRAWTGKAYAQSLLPPNFSLDDIK